MFDVSDAARKAREDWNAIPTDGSPIVIGGPSSVTPALPGNPLTAPAAIINLPTLEQALQVNKEITKEIQGQTREIEKARERMAALVAELGGQKAIQAAEQWTEAVRQIGGVTRLSAEDQAK